jgi:hypothetical protein
LFYDIKNRGYAGSRSNLERLLKVWREAENIQSDEPPADMDLSEPVRDPDAGHMISSVVAAALCLKPGGRPTDRQPRKVNALKHGSRVFAIMRGLAMRFPSVLRRDIDAIKNAIELRWSNGQADGQINCLKML